MEVVINITPEKLIELGNVRAESPEVKNIFNQIKKTLQEKENEICSYQQLIYDIENYHTKKDYDNPDKAYWV